jgi:hypothetical protein
VQIRALEPIRALCWPGTWRWLVSRTSSFTLVSLRAFDIAYNSLPAVALQSFAKQSAQSSSWLALPIIREWAETDNGRRARESVFYAAQTYRLFGAQDGDSDAINGMSKQAYFRKPLMARHRQQCYKYCLTTRAERVLTTFPDCFCLFYAALGMPLTRPLATLIPCSAWPLLSLPDSAQTEGGGTRDCAELPSCACR